MTAFHNRVRPKIRPGWTFSAFVLHGESVYVCACGGSTYALDALPYTGGAVEWVAAQHAGNTVRVRAVMAREAGLTGKLRIYNLTAGAYVANLVGVLDYITPTTALYDEYVSDIITLIDANVYEFRFSGNDATKALTWGVCRFVVE